MITDITRASEGAQFWYVPTALTNTGAGNSICIQNATELTNVAIPCATYNMEVGKRYIVSMDFAPFLMTSPNGGVGVSQPVFEYAFSNAGGFGYDRLFFVDSNGVTIPEMTSVAWNDVKTSWTRGFLVITAKNGYNYIAYSTLESATAGGLFDNTNLKAVTVTSAGLGTTTCNPANNARIFPLSPVSNVGGLQTLKYTVTAPTGYTVSPTMGTYGDTTIFTLTKDVGSAIGTGPLTVTVADEINTECTVTQEIPDVIQPNGITLSLSAATCVSATGQNDGKISLTSINNADKYGVSTGASYTGTDYATATVLGSLPLDLQTGIPNAGATYTFRFFNGSNTCFKDTTYTVDPVLCCAIEVVSATPSGCDPGATTYDLDVVVMYANPPSGNITVVTSNGAMVSVPQTISPQTITFTGLTRDGVIGIDVTAAFAANAICTHALNAAYDAPVSYSIACAKTDETEPQLNDGTAVVTPTGDAPFTYLWSNGATTASITGLAAGTYTVAVQDVHACPDTCFVTIGEPACALAAAATGTDETCNEANDGTATASSTGGFGTVTYAWSNAAGTAAISDLDAGTYTVTATDAAGCESTAEATITQPDVLAPTCSGTDVTTVGGSDGTVSVMVLGGTPNYAYLWSNGDTISSLTGLGAGTYTVTVTDANGCTQECTKMIQAPAEMLAIGNLIFMDINENGVFDSGIDMGIGGVMVQLFAAGANPATDTPLFTQTTTGAGQYVFASVAPGNYFIHIPAGDFATGSPLFNKTSTSPDGADDAVDNNDNGQNARVAGGVSTATIVMVPSMEPTGEDQSAYTGALSDNRVNYTIDLGFVAEKVAIGNLVFMDMNFDGNFDTGIDLALDGVDVQLFHAGDDPAAATPVGTTTTAGGGFYLFDHLAPGMYFVHISAAEFAVGGTLINKLSAAVQGGDTATDETVDENGLNTPVAGGTSTGVIDLRPNTEPNGEVGTYGGTLDDDNVNLTVDLGFYTNQVATACLVFMDMNGNTNYDAGIDTAFDGVHLQLYHAGDDPTADAPLSSTVTSGGGVYQFDTLAPGQYFIFIPGTEFATGAPLHGKILDNPIAGGFATDVMDLQPGAQPAGQACAALYTGTLPILSVNARPRLNMRNPPCPDPNCGTATVIKH